MATAAEVLHEYCAHVDQNYLLHFAELNTGDISEDLAIMATDREPLIGSNHPTLGGFVRYLIRSDREILSLTYLPCSGPWTPSCSVRFTGFVRPL